MPQVFVSHSANDQEFVEREILDLLGKHHITYWYSREHIDISSDWFETMQQGLQTCQWVLVVLSQASAKSDWVRKEVLWAVKERPGKIVPVRMEPCPYWDSHLVMQAIQGADFAGDRGEARRRLLAVFENRADGEPKRPESWWGWARDLVGRATKPTGWVRMTCRGLLLGILCAVASWLLTRAGPLRAVEEQWFFDGCFHARGPRATQAKVVLVDLDDESLDQLHKPAVFISPELAEVVRYLKKRDAAAIGLDLIIPEGLSRSPDAEKLEGDKLGAAIAEARNVVLAKQIVKDDRLLRTLARDKQKMLDERTRQILMSESWQLPLIQWQLKSQTDPSSTDLAFIDLTEDDDQIVRRQQLFEPDGSRHFALALFELASHQEVRWQQGLWLGSQQVPLDEGQKMRINFVGPPSSFPVVPFHEVFSAARGQGSLAEDVAGAIVIIGAAGAAPDDRHATPYANKTHGSLFRNDAGLMCGPEIHANIIATLADRAFFRAPPWQLLAGAELVLGAVLGMALIWLRTTWGLVLGGLLCAGWIVFSWEMFCSGSWRIELFAPLLLTLLTFAAVRIAGGGRRRLERLAHSLGRNRSC